MRHLKSIILGIFAGMAISFGGLVNLVCIANGHKLLGNILFGVGLLIVCSFGLFLFTGKIGYVLNNKKDYLLDLLMMYIGNILGATGVGYAVRVCVLNNDVLMDTATSVATKKIISDTGSTWYGVLIMGILCGVLVYLAVDAFKNEKLHPVIRLFVLLFCVAAFVIAGFEHCIANMFYFAFANSYGVNFGMCILSLVLCTIGNSIGAIMLNEGIKFAKSEEAKKTAE